MTLRLFSIISLVSIIIKSLLAYQGNAIHQLIYAAFALFSGLIIWQNRTLEIKYKPVLQRIAIAFFVSAILHLIGGIFPDIFTFERILHAVIIPCILINVCLLMAFYKYFMMSMEKMSKMRLRGNLVFGTLIIIVSFAQVFINQQLVIDLILIDILVLMILALTTVLIATRALSLIISAKYSNINKNSLLLVLGFFAYSISNLILIFNFNHLLAHKFAFQYSSLKMIAYVLIVYAVLNAKLNNLPLSFVKLEQSKKHADFNLVWVVIFLPTLLLAIQSISLLDFTIQLIIIIGYQSIDYYYNKSNDIDELLKQEEKNMKSLKNKLDERVSELTFANKQLDIRVNQDALTGLKNRYFLNGKMNEFLQSPPLTFTFMYLDLDNFKIINDIQGHNIGDIVLQEVAKRLMQFNDAQTDICRIGGDEFILLTPEADENKLSKLASDVTASIIQPIEIDNMEFTVGASIGIATIPTSVKRFKDLLRSAEIAMYIAKQSDSSNRTVFYQSSRSETIKRSNILSLSLNSNKLFKELKLIYLPIVQLDNNQILAAEVSIRWKHSELGIVETNEFLNVVDQTDKTKKVMTWFIKKSIEEVGKWQVNYDNRIKLHLKLSVQTLSIMKLTQTIKKALKDYHLRPEDLCIDIKESEVIRSYAMIKDTLTELKSLGITIAVSDFGDGKTAFHILRQIDFDYIKFAHTFVEHIDTSERDNAILKAMMDLSQNLNRTPIVPFIENKEQLDSIQALRAPLASGNYLKHSLGSQDFEELYLKPLKSINK